MKCPKCAQLFEGAICPNCQVPVAELGDNRSQAFEANPYSAPQNQAPPNQAPQQYSGSDPAQEGDGTGGVIPYKNPKALIAYYLGIVSGLPFIGFPFGIAAFVLGIMGLKDRKRNPVIKGSAHAWIGIGCGGLFAVFWGLMIIGLIITRFVN